MAEVLSDIENRNYNRTYCIVCNPTEIVASIKRLDSMMIDSPCDEVHSLPILIAFSLICFYDYVTGYYVVFLSMTVDRDNLLQYYVEDLIT